jgi:hypothetical protein
MDDETAFERQHGPVHARHDPHRIPQRYPRDTLWEQYCLAYQRMQARGLSRAEAAEVFRPLLEDPERASAAELMLAAGSCQQETSSKSNMPLASSKQLLEASLAKLAGLAKS